MGQISETRRTSAARALIQRPQRPQTPDFFDRARGTVETVLPLQSCLTVVHHCPRPHLGFGTNSRNLTYIHGQGPNSKATKATDTRFLVITLLVIANLLVVGELVLVVVITLSPFHIIGNKKLFCSGVHNVNSRKVTSREILFPWKFEFPGNSYFLGKSDYLGKQTSRES